MMNILKWRIRFATPSTLDFLDSPLLWAGIVGFLGAISSVLFRQSLQFLEHLVSQSSEPLEDAVAKMNIWQRLLIPTIGGLIAGLVITLGNRLTTKSSKADFMETVVLGKGRLSVRATLVRTLSSLITNGTGGSIGREGPMVSTAAMLGSVVGRYANFTVARCRLLVACGAAAGIACAYNAPITGALFVAEILLGSIAMESFGPLVFSSVVATVTAHQFLRSGPVYNIPDNVLTHVPTWQLVFFVILGLVAGLFAPAFLAILRISEKAFRSSKLSEPYRFALGGLIVGIISIHSPFVWGNGYSVVENLLQAPYPWFILADILFCKVLATASTTGSGAVGGVFTPTLFCGAAMGVLFAQAESALLPGLSFEPNSFALVGMGCFLAATTHAPIMSILIIFEMTLTYGAVMPLMLGCTTAFYVARQLGAESMYSKHLRGGGPKSKAPLFLLHVSDLMKPNPLAIPGSASFTQIVGIFASNTFKHLYVVSPEGSLLGAIALQDLKPFLQDSDMPNVVLAIDLVQEIPCLSSGDSLQESLIVFARHDGERLPIIDNPTNRRLVGALSKTDVLLTLAHGTEFNEM